MYLIIGASGFIGRHLYDYCKKNKLDVLGTYYTHPYCGDWVKFDICINNLSEICLHGKSLEAVIICGANASIDNCKKNEEASYQLNVLGTKRILRQADEMGVKSVFLSSEAVFDGRMGLYTEEDTPNPVTLYGRQKLLIEQYMIQNLRQYLIFRISRATSSVYGENDIFNEFYTKIVNNEEIVCLKDQSFCLTEVTDIVQGILKALESDINGLYHLSSDNFLSRYELANLYAKKIFGGYSKILEKEYNNIPFLDNRSVYGGLKGGKLAEVLGIHYMSVSEILNRYAETYAIRYRI